MAVTLTWIRDNFDANKNRYIDASEADAAKDAWGVGTIDATQFGAVMDAYYDRTQLPEYGTTPTITCAGSTPHYANGCALLKHYDSRDGNANGVIMSMTSATIDKNSGVITQEEFDFVDRAYKAGSINAVCPGCFASTAITCAGSTPHYANGCALLKHYDLDDGGKLDISEFGKALTDKGNGVITNDEFEFVKKAYDDVNINALCPGCHSVLAPPEPAPPGSETRPITLEEGKSYPIQISLAGYDTVNATIRVSATGVSCTSGPCGTTGLPRVDASGWTVSMYLKAKSVSSSYSNWLSGKGGLNSIILDDIFELKDALIGLAALGFTPSMEQIMECKDAFIGL